MIQRIQSIWLLLASACAFLSLKLPYYSGTNKEGIPAMRLTASDNIYIMILTVAVAVLSLLTIFLYSNRGLQLRLCFLGLLMEGLIIFLYYREIKTYLDGTYALSALLQGCIVLFLFLAARGINNDRKIIKDSNRLR